MCNINIKQQLRLFYHDERGSYVVSCALLSTVMVTMASFGLDGAHFIHQKARLSDALEQAALALTAEDSPETRGDNERHRQLATHYVQAYMPQLKALPRVDVTVKTPNKTQNEAESVTYHVQAHNLHHSLIYSDFYQTFPSSVTIGDNAVAQKHYALASTKKRDIVFVLDASSSMYEFWCEDKKHEQEAYAKYYHLNEVKEITLNNTKCIRKIERLKRDALKEVENINKLNSNSRIAIVPFDVGVLYKNECYMPFVSTAAHHPIEMFYLDKKDIVASFSKRMLNEYNLKAYSDDYPLTSPSDIVDIERTLINKKQSFLKAEENIGKFIFDDNDSLNKLKSIYVEDEFNDMYRSLNLGYHKPLKDKHPKIFTDNLINGRYFPKLFNNGCSGNSSSNEALLLTSNIPEVKKKITAVGGGGRTIVLSGILVASQLLNESSNDTFKQIIFISDTEDNQIDFTNDFIKAGLCQDVNWQLSVIPISHEPKIQWNKCLLDPVTRKANQGNVVIPISEVKRPSEFASALKGAIFGREKVGHNVVKD